MFSIVVPIFNSEKYLESLISKLSSQTFQDFEIIFVDGGSSDSGWKFIYQACDSLSVRYVYILNDSGPLGARLFGASIGLHEWICFLDCDDYWSDDKLDILSREINATKNDLYAYFDDCVLFNSSGEKSAKLPVSRKFSGYDYFFRRGIINSGVSVHRKHLTDINDASNIDFAEDTYLWLRLMLDGVFFKRLESALVFYNVGDPKSRSANWGKTLKSVLVIYIELGLPRILVPIAVVSYISEALFRKVFGLITMR